MAANLLTYKYSDSLSSMPKASASQIPTDCCDPSLSSKSKIDTVALKADIFSSSRADVSGARSVLRNELAEYVGSLSNQLKEVSV